MRAISSPGALDVILIGKIALPTEEPDAVLYPIRKRVYM